MVIDASVAFKWFVWENGSEDALQLLDQLTLFHAPEIFPIELDAILTRKVRKREIEIRDAWEKREQFRKLPYLLTPYSMIGELAFRLSNGFSITLYDASYLATAVVNEAVLFTADRKLFNGLSATPFSKYVSYTGS